MAGSLTAFALDTFAGSSGTALTAHTDNLGNTWTVNTVDGTTGIRELTGSGQVMGASGTGGPTLYNSATPPSANYTVQFDIISVGTPGAGFGGVWARLSSSALTGYLLQFQSGGYKLYKCVAAAFTQLGSTYTAAATTGVQLVVSGTTISAVIGGVTVITATDSAVSAAGYAGIRHAATGTTNALLIANFIAGTPAASGSFLTFF